LQVVEACFERHGRRADIGACRRQFAQWRREVGAASWRHFADIKTKYRSADLVAGRTVFNISGNNYRLIVVISYIAGVVEIRFMGTHREYDAVDVGRV